jgi:hypothetical protein
MTNLKPCPYCDGESSEPLPDSFGYRVSCRKCGANVFGNTRKIAIDRWNRRARPKAVGEPRAWLNTVYNTLHHHDPKVYTDSVAYRDGELLPLYPPSDITATEIATLREGGLHPATACLVWNFALALANKLHDAEVKYGYSDGWRSRDWMDECRAKLREHIEKGDPRDVAAYCAFLWNHGERTNAPPSNARPEPDSNAEPNGSGRNESVVGEAVAAPLGWKLVPVEPTQEMYYAGNKEQVRQETAAGALRSAAKIYRAMLAAAPAASPPAGEHKCPYPDNCGMRAAGGRCANLACSVVLAERVTDPFENDDGCPND